MLVKKRIAITRKLPVLGADEDAVLRDLQSSFVGYHYMVGIVRSVELNCVGSFSPSIGKGGNTTVSADVTFNILAIPPGFVIANATVRNIKQDSNNTTYVLAADIGSIAPIIGNTALSQDNENRIFGFITTMNKSPESLNMYKHLIVGSRVNLVCLANIFAEGKAQPLSFNANIIERVNPKCFLYDKSIDTDRIAELAVGQKVDFPLFADHRFSANGKKPLIEGSRYFMTIYGFAEADDQPGIDFISMQNSLRINTPAGMENIIGLNTLNNYLYFVMSNWIYALKVLSSS
jgi:hypothetical protein